MGDWSFKTGEFEYDTLIATFLSLDAAERFWPNCAMNAVWYKFSGDKADMKPPRPKTGILLLLLFLHLSSHFVFCIAKL